MFSFFFDLKKIQKIQLYLAFWYHSVSPQLRVPEKRTLARLKGLVLGFHFGQQVSPCRRAPPPEF